MDFFISLWMDSLILNTLVAVDVVFFHSKHSFISDVIIYDVPARKERQRYVVVVLCVCLYAEKNFLVFVVVDDST